MYEKINEPPTVLTSNPISAGTGENNSSITVNNLEANCYYVCILTCRKKISTLNITNAEKIYSTAIEAYLNYAYTAHFAYIHTTGTSATFSIPGTNGMSVTCYKLK